MPLCPWSFVGLEIVQPTGKIGCKKLPSTGGIKTEMGTPKNPMKLCNLCKQRHQSKRHQRCKACRITEGGAVYNLPLPQHPTKALPGSPEKIEIMTKRILKNTHLHHPNDSTFESESKKYSAEIVPSKTEINIDFDELDDEYLAN